MSEAPIITLAHAWRGRHQTYRDDLTDEIRANMAETVQRANMLLARASRAGVTIENSPTTKNPVSSGWRPPSVNASTQGAALRSKHMTGQAIDVFDPDGDLDDWCMDNLSALEAIGLWLEHPSATKGWCHLQTVPPRSGKRVFYP